MLRTSKSNINISKMATTFFPHPEPLSRPTYQICIRPQHRGPRVPWYLRDAHPKLRKTQNVSAILLLVLTEDLGTCVCPMYIPPGYRCTRQSPPPPCIRFQKLRSRLMIAFACTWYSGLHRWAWSYAHAWACTVVLALYWDCSAYPHKTVTISPLPSAVVPR